MAIIIVIQFIRPARNTGGRVLETDITHTVSVSPEVLSVLQTACYDCHSNHTRYPWYANIQPIAWLLNAHVRDGKKELNFSEFGSYSERRQRSKMVTLAEQVEEGAMPLPLYRLLHSKARLTEKEKALIIEWATKMPDTVSTKKNGNE